MLWPKVLTTGGNERSMCRDLQYSEPTISECIIEPDGGFLFGCIQHRDMEEAQKFDSSGLVGPNHLRGLKGWIVNGRYHKNFRVSCEFNEWTSNTRYKRWSGGEKCSLKLWITYKSSWGFRHGYWRKVSQSFACDKFQRFEELFLWKLIEFCKNKILDVIAT